MTSGGQLHQGSGLRTLFIVGASLPTLSLEYWLLAATTDTAAAIPTTPAGERFVGSHSDPSGHGKQVFRSLETVIGKPLFPVSVSRRHDFRSFYYGSTPLCKLLTPSSPASTSSQRWSSLRGQRHRRQHGSPAKSASLSPRMRSFKQKLDSENT
ncbi:hypothetical protein CBL_05441 [Carabus blaptoides fortunei]